MMSILNSIRKRIQNNTRALGIPTVSLTSNTNEYVDDLLDLVLIEPSLVNARRAFEIDATVKSCVLSIVILTNSSYKIIADEYASSKAVQLIDKKFKSWNMDKIITTMIFKSILDGQCFIRKKYSSALNDIESVDILAYDEKAYNFIELRDEETGEILGYKQESIIHRVPSDWREQSFEALARQQGEKITTNFEADEVIHPILLNGKGLVNGVLDFVYISKKLENMIPIMVKRASMTLGVEVGTSERDFTPYEKNDPYYLKEQKINSKLEQIADKFNQKEKKSTIVHQYGVKPYVIGNGNMVDIIPLLDYLAQCKKEALLTPDSRFNSSSTNRATAETQMGSLGQKSIIKFLRDYISRYLEPQLIDSQLKCSGYEKDVGHVHIYFEDENLERDLNLAQIAKILEDSFPSEDIDERNHRINTYFQGYNQQNGVLEDNSDLVNFVNQYK